MRRPSGDQLGLEFIACDAPKESIVLPLEPRITTSDAPRLCLIAAIREPSGDHRGSAHCTSREEPVRAVIERPSGDSRTRRVVAGSLWTATISPSERTSGAVRRAPVVSRVCDPFRSTYRSFLMWYGSR